MKKFISILLAVCLLLSLGSTAFAAGTTTRQAELYYREVKILLDGKELIPQDVNGKSTEPFIIDGTTYLPIRAVASALGLKVEWKAETSAGAQSTPSTREGFSISCPARSVAAAAAAVCASENTRTLMIVHLPPPRPPGTAARPRRPRSGRCR